MNHGPDVGSASRLAWNVFTMSVNRQSESFQCWLVHSIAHAIQTGPIPYYDHEYFASSRDEIGKYPHVHLG
jgi:hypothetical protein